MIGNVKPTMLMIRMIPLQLHSFGGSPIVSSNGANANTKRKTLMMFLQMDYVPHQLTCFCFILKLSPRMKLPCPLWTQSWKSSLVQEDGVDASIISMLLKRIYRKVGSLTFAHKFHVILICVYSFYSHQSLLTLYSSLFTLAVLKELDLYIPAAQEELYNWVNGPNRQYEAGFRIVQSGEWGDYDGFYLMEGDSVPVVSLYSIESLVFLLELTN